MNMFNDNNRLKHPAFHDEKTEKKHMWSKIWNLLFVVVVVVLGLVLFLIACLVLSGCTQTIALQVKPDGAVTYYKSNSFCNYRQITDLVYDNNSISLGQYEGKPQKIQALTPWGIVETDNDDIN